jgi:hypothetical protein
MHLIHSVHECTLHIYLENLMDIGSTVNRVIR